MSVFQKALKIRLIPGFFLLVSSAAFAMEEGRSLFSCCCCIRSSSPETLSEALTSSRPKHGRNPNRYVSEKAIDQPDSSFREAATPTPQKSISLREDRPLYWEFYLTPDKDSKQKLIHLLANGKNCSASFHLPILSIKMDDVPWSSCESHIPESYRFAKSGDTTAPCEILLREKLQIPMENRFLGNDDEENFGNLLTDHLFSIKEVIPSDEDPLVLEAVLFDPEGSLKKFYTYSEQCLHKLQDDGAGVDFCLLENPQNKKNVMRIANMGHAQQRKRPQEEYQRDAKTLTPILTSKLKNTSIKFEYQTGFFRDFLRKNWGICGIQRYWRESLSTPSSPMSSPTSNPLYVNLSTPQL